MKKFLLTVMAILTIASGSVFGMYGADNTWLFPHTWQPVKS